MLKPGWGSRLALCRGGLSQRSFAPQLGLSVTIWSEYEREVRIPRLDTLVLVSEMSGKSLDWIATGAEVVPAVDLDVLRQVIQGVEESGVEISAEAKARLISSLYKDRIKALSQEMKAADSKAG